jgi:hypothetical protein
MEWLEPSAAIEPRELSKRRDNEAAADSGCTSRGMGTRRTPRSSKPRPGRCARSSSLRRLTRACPLTLTASANTGGSLTNISAPASPSSSSYFDASTACSERSDVSLMHSLSSHTHLQFLQQISCSKVCSTSDRKAYKSDCRYPYTYGNLPRRLDQDHQPH